MITQIAAIPESTENFATLFALDDQGRMWSWSSGNENAGRSSDPKWLQIKAPEAAPPELDFKAFWEALKWLEVECSKRYGWNVHGPDRTCIMITREHAQQAWTMRL